MNPILHWLEQNRREIRVKGRLRSAVLTREYQHSLAQLWSACTEPERLARWFGHVQGKLQVGQTLSIDAGLPQPISSQLLACEPERRLLLTWSYLGDPLDPPDEVEVLFSVAPTGSLLSIEHRSGVLYPWAPGVGSGWESWVWGLERTLQGNTAELRGAPEDVNKQIDAHWSQLLEPAAELQQSGQRCTLRLQRKFYAPREQVWAAVLSSLPRWYPARIEGQLVAGSPLRFCYEDGSVLLGSVLELDAPRLLVLREEQDEARVVLSAEPAGTLLTFEHEFDAPGSPAAYAAGWDGCLEHLVQAVAGRDAVEASEPHKQALRAAYARKFASPLAR